MAKKKIGLNVAYLAVLANSTPERFLSLWTSSSLDTGFLSRWMLVEGMSRQRLPNPPQPDAEALEEFCKELGSFVEIIKDTHIQTPYKIKFSSQAEELWNEYYINVLSPENPLHNRLDTIGMRLMMILTMACPQSRIKLEQVESVIEFLNYEARLREKLSPVAANNPLAELQARILRKLPNPGDRIRKRDLGRHLHVARRFDTKIFERALQGLRKSGYIATYKKGRSAIIERVEQE